MLRKIVSQVYKGEKGITGLETAIILIAFVVVAAVFAYTVLSAGLFATQKAQESVYSGLKEVRSTLELKGSVIAKAETTGAAGYVSQITFTLANALSGEPIDFTPPNAATDNTGVAASGNNTVVISYVDGAQRVNDLYWTITKLNADADDLLEADEKFQVTIGSATQTSGGGNLVNALSPDLIVNKQFTIQIRAPQGAVLAFERTTPAYIDSVFRLD